MRIYSVRGLERSELGGSHGCPGRLWDRFWEVYILRPKHRAYYRSGRPVIEIGPKGALGSHEIRPIHSALSLGQSIDRCITHFWRMFFNRSMQVEIAVYSTPTSIQEKNCRKWHISITFSEEMVGL